MKEIIIGMSHFNAVAQSTSSFCGVVKTRVMFFMPTDYGKNVNFKSSMLRDALNEPRCEVVSIKH